MSNRFDSATYLRGLGWNGPGSSLNNSSGGRAKPIVVAQKKTLSGVGRDRDTSFAWWDAVFSSVANKVGGDKVRPRSLASAYSSASLTFPPADRTAPHFDRHSLAPPSTTERQRLRQHDPGAEGCQRERTQP